MNDYELNLFLVSFDTQDSPSQDESKEPGTRVVLHSDDPVMTLTFEHPAVVPFGSVEDLLQQEPTRCAS